MNKYLKILCGLFASIALIQNSYSQTVIDYTGWSTSQCNAFYPSATVSQIVHTTTCGTVVYDNTNHAIELDTKADNNIYYGTEYKLAFNFKQGYSYTIKINAWCSTPTFPVPNSEMRVDFTSASNGSGYFCNGVESFNTTSSLTNDNNQVLSPGVFLDYTFPYTSLVSAQNNLYIGGFLRYVNGTATSWILIKKITITEIPPSVSFNITPASVSITCGSTTAIPFTINNVGGTGITNYTWNLGATPNGWKLPNGSDAPATYSTGTVNTLTLTPVCGSAQKNISATVTANGNNYNTNTSTVSITQPTLSINGASSFCTGSSNYSINNLPCNASVAWSISPATGVANLSCSSCATTSLSQMGYGTLTLTAVVSNLCGGTNVTLNKSIQIGSSPLTGTYTTATNTLPLQTVNFVPVGNIYTQYQWPGVSNITAALTSGAPPGTGFYASPGRYSFNIASGQQVSVYIAGNSACGAVNATRTYIQSSYYYLVVSPNPATNNINVGITEVVDTTGKMAEEQKLTSSNTIGITQMYLYDFNTGILVKQWNFKEMKSANYNLNIAGVKSGVYLLKMERNNKSTSTKIIVK